MPGFVDFKRRRPTTKPRSTRPSAEQLEQRLFLDGTVVFNEIMYNPPGDDESSEWVELHNQQGVDMDISNWALEGGVDFTFPEGTIVSGGGYLVVVGNSEGVPPPGATEAMGPFTGRLNNNGEELRLVNNSGRVVNSVDYGDRGDWPVAPDGSGASLAKLDASTASHVASSWTHSSQIGGTPGSANFILPGTYVNDEILPVGATARAFVPLDGNLKDDWIQPEFDDSSWTHGTTGVGYDQRTDYDDLLGLDLDAPPDDQAPISMQDLTQTVYVRVPFEVSGDISQYEQITMEMRFEDGFVAYLNGTEVAQMHAPGRDGDAGVLSWFSGATKSHSDRNATSPVSFDLTSHRDLFRQGQNVLAFHGLNKGVGGSSGDLLLLPEILGRRALEPDTSVPVAINEIADADETSFFVELVNTGSEPLEVGGMVLATLGENAAEYVLPAQTLAAGALLVVDAEQTGFRPAEGEQLFLFGPDKANVADGRRVTGRLRGSSESHDGRWLFPDKPTPGADNTFAINDNVVINELFYQAPTIPLIPGMPPSFETTTYVDIESTWRHSKDFTFGGGDLPVDPGPDWQNTAHTVDSISWFEAQAPLGFGRVDRGTPRINTQFTDPAFSTNYITTYYFETEFGVTQEQLDELDELQLQHVVDDGAVFYINGQEVLRTNMPEGPATFETLAIDEVDRAALSEPQTISMENLVALPAMNRISVEVHQNATDSGDIAFAAALLGRDLVDLGFSTQRPVQPEEEWIELFNRSETETVDLSEWRLSDGIDFEFEPGTKIGPGQFLVVANDPAALRAKHPGLAADTVLGPFGGTLSNGGELIQLRDPNDNPADRVDYRDSGRWPENANGGYSSLELLDPDADNALAEAWEASDESGRSSWQTYTYRDTGEQGIRTDPSRYNEFLFGLLRDGEFLIDDISVVQNPGTPDAQQLIQNGTFDADTVGGQPDKWRIIGNQHGVVAVDPDDPTNQVVHLRASGNTSHEHNNAGTTLKAGDELVRRTDADATYEISFRAKWLSGSNQLHTRLYFNRAARTNLLETPDVHGTPGQPNSKLVDNHGPTYEGLQHAPVVPVDGAEVTVTIAAADPDDVATMTLWYSVDSGAFASVPMSVGSAGNYVGTIPGQASDSTVQFYVEGKDGLGATSTFPRHGADSRALYEVQDGNSNFTTGVHNFRVIMTPGDTDFLHEPTNVMSNAPMGATVVYNERDVFYDVNLRLKGSERGRNQPVRVGYLVTFDPLQPFRGVYETVGIDRSGAGNEFSQKEILVKHGIHHAGDIPSPYDDLIHLISPNERLIGSAMLMTGFRDYFLETAYENGAEGTVFEYELIYNPTTTVGGDPEGLKLPEPDAVVGAAMTDHGPDREAYRWYWLIENNRSKDDYEQLMVALQALGQREGEQFHEDTQRLLDVDSWLRTFAVQVLYGIGDNYATSTNPWHNAQFYARPDGKTLYFPYDMDFTFSQGATSAIVNNTELRKMLDDVGNEHMYLGHLHDIMSTTFNSEYMDPWIDHYQSKLTSSQNYSGFKRYIEQRHNSVQGRLPDEAPFEITTNTPLDVGDSTTADVEGTGWINVREIRIAGSDSPLPVTWTDLTAWQATLPVDQSTKKLTLQAFDFQGDLIGTVEIDVNSTVANPVADSLRITEVHYNPSAPTSDELAVNPSFNNDDFEFVELQNTGDVPINLLNVNFSDGISYQAGDESLLPSVFGVIVSNREAFQLRYGDSIRLLGEYEGNLRNSGEQVVLRDAQGNVIHDFEYNDNWYLDADGNGASLAIVDTSGDYSNASNWRRSVKLGGSPGEEEPFTPQAGDANLDQAFNQRDLVQVQIAAKYLTGQAATWGEGDWNGDSVFNPLDIVAALQRDWYDANILGALTKLSANTEATDNVFRYLGQA